MVMGFSTAFYLLQLEKMYRGVIDEDELIYPFEWKNFAFTSSFMSQYYILLGDFGDINLEDETSFANELCSKMLFFVTTLTTQILMLNMLIALMSQTFTDYLEREYQYEQKQRLSMIADYILIVDICCRGKKKRKHKRYVVVVTRVVDEEDDDDALDGEN